MLLQEVNALEAIRANSRIILIAVEECHPMRALHIFGENVKEVRLFARIDSASLNTSSKI